MAKSTESVCELEFLGSLQTAADPLIGAGFNRREFPRFPVRCRVQVQPLDENLAPCGDPVDGMTADISWKGIGLLAGVPLQARFLRVRLNVPQTRNTEMLYEVVYREAFGSFCRIGCRSVRRGQTTS